MICNKLDNVLKHDCIKDNEYNYKASTKECLLFKASAYAVRLRLTTQQIYRYQY